ncbi:MAG: DEAD/DEAH box helicase family protein [Chloroflexi bacterium]|nr:DEAD/DEAH box helicase family protein [Chloroflexota bacterium]
MPEQFLYQELDSVSRFGGLAKEIPNAIRLNLAPKYELRAYQVEAFARFMRCSTSDFPGKARPLHLMFNMATGSGKTLIMAGLILYLYEQGYRNFLFFVNSTNIIEKTKDNFLNPASIKYLFNPAIVIGNRRVRVTPVENFEAVNPNDINICFTTIQKLHSDLTSEKENALTYADFRKHKVVLMADEAHHINVQTRAQQAMFESWENTVQRIFEQNADNLLLEFTATHDYETPAMVDKYRHKVIIRYDLLQFRNDRFSKDVVLVYSDFDLDARILQAVILSQYKQEVAAKYRINLKPVLLFKAQRTIEQSRENQANFNRLIARLTTKDIENIRRKSNLALVRRAFSFFDVQGISAAQLVERVKREFHPDHCLSVNDESEKVNYQILVNTLEDKQNRIRAIFAVQKLNEGWDVLNLFDIVRCYEPRDTGRAKIGSITLSEAQLIGRGARYFPFILPESDERSFDFAQDRFRRKFDGNLGHELRVIEELHYHSINDSRYIAEIRDALIEQGILGDQVIERKLELKAAFKKTPFYKKGVVWFNERQPKDYQPIRSLADLGVKRKNYVHSIATGHGDASAVLATGRQGRALKEENRVDVKITTLPRNLLQSAIARNPFFTFASLKRYFPHLASLQDFIGSEKYLGGLEITFQGNVYGLDDNKSEKLAALIGLLNQVETEMRQQITEYQGSRDFRHDWVHQIFTDKVLRFDKNNERGKDDAQFEYFVSSKDWFAFNTVYGTREEKDFVRMLDRQMDKLKAQYEGIYLVRNEGHFAIYNFSDGQAFQPDYILFLREKSGALLTYQLFIEPKGKHLKEHDRWKEKFLEEITEEFKARSFKFEDKKYRLIGVPFYNNADENQFRADLESALA